MLEPLPEKPTIGVYALTYNHEDFIAEAIESVLTQNWPADRLNFVLLDDGSTDKTPEIVKPYERHLTFVRQQNAGINSAVNRLLSMTDGDVLLPVSGDDTLPPDRFERVVERFQEQPAAGLVYGDMEAIDERGRVLATSVLDELIGEARPTGQVAGRLLTSNFISAGSMAVRGTLKPVMLPIPADAAWEDWWFVWALTNAAPIDYLDTVTYRYRRHQSNFMFGITERDQEAVLDRHIAEIPFRRYLLGNVRPGTCRPSDLFDAADSMRSTIPLLVSQGRELDAIVPVSDLQRAAAERLAADAAALAATGPILAAFTAARALAADPGNGPAFKTLHTVAGSPSTFTTTPLQDVRALTVFVEAEELAAHPGLLAAYVDAAGQSDDVTLVTVARAWDSAQLGAGLGPVIDQVPGANRLDIVALPAGRASWLTAFTHADAALGLDVLPLPGVPRFDAAEPLSAHLALRRRFPIRRP